MKKSFIRKLFWNPNYFTIAIRKKRTKEDTLLMSKKFEADVELKGKRDYWIADPILVQDDDETFLFYEACFHGKGRIEVVRLQENGSVSKPQIALEKEYHLSYPFVFKEGGEWYMIPESCSCNKVQLFKAKEFPSEWEFKQNLLDGYFVDTTVLSMKEQKLLVTFRANNNSESVEPKAYRMKKKHEEIVLEEIEWNEYDSLKVRGAGGFIQHNGMTLRPVQISQLDRYGDGIQFNECIIAENQYTERDCFRIYPKDIRFNKYYFDGLHTYSATDKYEAIDVRCYFFEFFKPFNKLISLYKRRATK